MAKYNFVSRRLSDYECVLDLLRNHGDGVVCHVMIMRTKFRISKAIMRSALQRLVHHQPVLRMRVHTERGVHGIAKRFVERPGVDEMDITEVDNSLSSWEFSVQEECCQPLMVADGRLWKVLFMDITGHVPHGGAARLLTYAIILKISHVISDHVSLFHLMTRQLRVLLRDEHQKGESEKFKVPLFVAPSVDQSFTPASSIPVVPPVVKKKTKSLRTPTMKRKMNSASGSLPSLSDEYPFSNVSLTKSPRTRLCRCVLHAHDSRRLLRMCRKYEVTVQDVFTVAAAHAFYMTKHAQKLPLGKGCIHICHWLDMRSYHSAPSDSDPLGMWLCPVFTKHKHINNVPKYSIFWDQVKKLSESLKPENEPWRSTFDEFKKALHDVNKYGDIDVTDSVPRVSKSHASVSYLDVSIDSGSEALRDVTSRTGRTSSDVDSGDIPEYHIVNAVTSSSISPMHLSVVRGNETVTCALTRDDNTVPQKFAEKFIAIICKLITTMVRNNKHDYVVIPF